MGLDIATEDRPTVHYVGAPVSAPLSEFGAPGGPNEQVPRIYGWLDDHQITPLGGPLYIYRHVGDPGDTVDLTVAVPVAGTVSTTDGLVSGCLPAGTYVVGRHVGAPDAIPTAHAEVTDWAGERGIRLGVEQDAGDPPWNGHAEHFLTDPAEEPDPSRWVTELLFMTA